MSISYAERQYISLVYEVKKNGSVKMPTKGKALALAGSVIQLPPDDVPLLHGRKIYHKGLEGELRAFLANENTEEGFRKHGCNFWGAWANEDGTLDVDYARLLHDFNGVNQLERLIDGLKNKPDSRKHVISLWDPSSRAKQVPCVLSYQWFVEDGILGMLWTQRSADIMVGLASDMYSAWLFNHVIASEVGLQAGTVMMSIGDAHIYEAHLPLVDKYLDDVGTQPDLNVGYKIQGGLDFDIEITGYKPQSVTKFELLV